MKTRLKSCLWLVLLAASFPAAGQNRLSGQQSDTTVTVGYVRDKTLSIAGAVDVLNADQLSQKQMNSPLEAINGRVAGVTVQKSNNGVAAMNAVRVRGTTSLTGGNDPLVIIDGVFGDLSTLSSIYPTDIESFTILKDASETAQYGSRGASGVIEVTTKRGSKGRATVSYTGNFGFSRVYRNLSMLNADGYRREVSARGLMLIDKGYNTDWQREIEQTAFLHDHHVALSGGTETAGYRVALAYMNHQGIIKHDNLRNLTSNMSLYQDLFNGRVKVDVGMFGSVQTSTTAIYDQQKMFYSAQTFNPTFGTQRNPDGSWDGFTYANQITHPMALLDSRTQEKTTHLSVRGKVTANLGRGWELAFFGAYSYNEVEKSQFLPTYIWAHGQAYRGTAKTSSLLDNISLSWEHSWNNKHNLSVLLLSEGGRDELTGFHTTTTNFDTNAMGYDNIQAGALVPWDGTGSYREVPTMAAFMGRVSYDLDNRYAITASLRADGSSKLAKNHRWGYFPSVSASWAIGKESWFKSATWLENLKLRAGLGLAGNQGGIDSYLSMATVHPVGVIDVGEKTAISMATLRNANPELKWEIKRTVNFGVDAAFLGNRIIASVDVYTAKTYDMLYLYNLTIPPYPYDKLLANMGSMRNSGVEIALGFTPLTTRDMELNINANITYQSNKLLSLSGYVGDQYLTGGDYSDIASLDGAGFHGGKNHIVYQVVGQPLGVFYLPHCTGLVSDGKGGYRYAIADLDGDGEASIAGDRQLCGQAMPKVLLGTNFSFRYKRFDITLQVNGAFGHKIYNGSSLTYMNMNNLPGYNVLAKAPAQNIQDLTATDYWLERGDYVNFDYLTLGWNLPLGATISKYVSRLRLSATVENLATITGYSGLTPMINSSTVNSTLGVDDKNIYPVSRTFTIGLNVTF